LLVGLYSAYASEERSYQGLDHSPVKVLGTFERIVTINDVLMKIKFIVVPDQAMAYTAILMRDYILSPLVNITLGRKCKIEKAGSDSDIDGIMKIEYVGKAESIAGNLDINPEVDADTASTVKRIFHDEMFAFPNLNSSSSDTEFVITLESVQVGCFHPGRLAFADKEQLHKILDDFCKKEIIRPCYFRRFIFL
jgi:hypothetical protein